MTEKKQEEEKDGKGRPAPLKDRRTFLRETAATIFALLAGKGETQAEAPDTLERSRLIQNILKDFSPKDVKGAIPGAGSIEVPVRPEHPAGCIILLRQLHMMSDQLHTQEEIERKSGPIIPFSLSDPETWEDLIEIQTNIYRCIEYLRRKKDIRTVYHEGISEEEWTKNLLNELRGLKLRISIKNSEVAFLEPLATLWNQRRSLEITRKIIEALENGVLNQANYRPLSELRDMLKEREPTYERAKQEIPEKIKESKREAEKRLQEYQQKLRDAEKQTKHELQQEMILRITSLKEIVRVLDTDTTGEEASMRAHVNHSMIEGMRKDCTKVDAIITSYTLASSVLVKRGLVRVRPTEDRNLNKKAGEALVKRDWPEFEKWQGKREEHAIDRIVQDGLPVAPLIFGGNHRKGFEEAVKKRNHEHPNSPYALIVVTPQGYKEDGEK